MKAIQSLYTFILLVLILFTAYIRYLTDFLMKTALFWILFWLH